MPRYTSEDCYRLLQTIHTNQMLMMNMLSKLTNQENQMAVDLSKMTTEVQNNSTVEGSVLALVKTLVAEIAAIPPSNDPVTQAALDALTGTLAANDTALAAAVTANTPVPPTPVPAPAPSAA